MSLMKTETAMTPGVEVPQDPYLIEDEHTPPENPPEAPTVEPDSQGVDKLATEKGKPIASFITHIRANHIPHLRLLNTTRETRLTILRI